MNIIKQIAEHLGVSVGEEFKTANHYSTSLWKFDERRGLLVKHSDMADWNEACGNQYMKMLNGDMKVLKMASSEQKKAKPPLGIEPYWLHRSRRIQNILVSIQRYSVFGERIPRDWLLELNKYIKEMEEEAEDGRSNK